MDKEELYFSDETPAASSPSESGRRRSERRTAGARRGRPDGSASSASEQVPVKLAFPGNDFEGRDTGAGGWHACLCAFFFLCPTENEHWDLCYSKLEVLQIIKAED